MKTMLTRLLAMLVLLLALLAAQGTFAYDNLVPNSSFEEGLVEGLPSGWPTPWGPPFGEFVTLSDERASDGSTSLKVAGHSGASVGLRSEKIAAAAGETFLATVQAYNESGLAQVFLEFWNAAGERIAKEKAASSQAEQWFEMSVEAIAPPTTTHFTVLLYSRTSNKGTTYYDNVTVVRTSQAKEAEIAVETSSAASDQPVTPVTPPAPAAASSLERVFTRQGQAWADGLQRPDTQQALTNGFDIKVTDHPRLNYTRAEFKQIKEAAERDPRLRSMVSSLVTAAITTKTAKSYSIHYYAGKDVTYSLPPEEPEPIANPDWFAGDTYPYWTMMSREIQRRLEKLALGYALSGDKDLGETAKEYALAMAAWSTWTNKPVGNSNTGLETAHITMGMVVAYDLIYDLLSDEERGELRRAIVEKGLRLLYTDTADAGDYNKDLLRTSALGLGGLALLGEIPDAEAYVLRAYKSSMQYLDERMDSGQTEGLKYTSYALSYIEKFTNALARVTGNDDFYQHPWLSTVLPEWVNYFLAPGGREAVNFSDSKYDPAFGVMTNLASRVNNGLAGWYVLKAGSGGSTADHLLQQKITVASPESLDLASSKAFWDIGWVAFRSGWGNSDTLLAFQSSQSQLLHNQYDQNNFILNVSGQWLLTDPGYKDDGVAKKDVTKATVGHNSLLVDGNGQTSMGAGELVEFFHSPAYDFTTGEAGRGYSSYGVTGWERKILFNRPNYFIVVDHVEAAQPVQLDFLFHTDKDGTITVGGQDVPIGTATTADSSFCIAKKAKSVDGYVVAPRDVQLTYTEISGREEYGPYIQVSPATPQTEATVVTVLYPHLKKGETQPDIQSQVWGDIVEISVDTDAVKEYTAINGGHLPGTKNASALSFSGDHAVARYGENGALAAFSLANGTLLRGKAGQTLLKSDVPITGAVQLLADKAEGELWSEQPAQIELYVGAASSVSLNGQEISVGEVTIDNGTLVLSIDKGSSIVSVRR